MIILCLRSYTSLSKLRGDMTLFWSSGFIFRGTWLHSSFSLTQVLIDDIASRPSVGAYKAYAKNL